MSGKYENRKEQKSNRRGVILAAAIAVLLLVVLAVFFLKQDAGKSPDQAQTAPETKEIMPKAPEKPRIYLRNGLEIVDIGPYTGIYMEDGTDEILSGILMMKIVNTSDDVVEYAKITMDANGETAEFAVSTLLPGATIVLLEKNRMAYDKSVDYASGEMTCENLALFKEPLSMLEDKLEVQILNGAINVTNISDEDITGRIAICYKNVAAGVYYGGITYRIVLEGGLKAGEIRQMTASHFSETGSEIMFISII